MTSTKTTVGLIREAMDLLRRLHRQDVFPQDGNQPEIDRKYETLMTELRDRVSDESTFAQVNREGQFLSDAGLLEWAERIVSDFTLAHTPAPDLRTNVNTFLTSVRRRLAEVRDSVDYVGDFAALDRIATACYENAKAKGFNGDEEQRARLDTLIEKMRHTVGLDDGDIDLLREVRDDYARALTSEKIALAHSELSEALEDLRNPNMDFGTLYYKDVTSTSGMRTEDDPLFQGGKPIGGPSEYADAVIRILESAKKRGMNIARAISEKMKYNASRPTLHGGKRM